MTYQDITSVEFYEHFMSTPLTETEVNKIVAQIHHLSEEIKILSQKIKGQKEKNSLMKDMNRLFQAINSSAENREKFYKFFKYATLFQNQSQLQQQEYRMFLMQAKLTLGLNIDTGRSLEKHAKAMPFTLAYFPLLTRLKIIKEGNDPDNLCQQKGVKRVLVFINEEPFQIPNIKGEMVEVPTGKFIFCKEKKTKKNQIEETQNQQNNPFTIQSPIQTDGSIIPQEGFFENTFQPTSPLPSYPPYFQLFDSFTCQDDDDFFNNF